MSTKISNQESRRLCRFLKANEAVSALEYAMLVGVIAVAIGAAIVTFGDNLKTTLEDHGRRDTGDNHLSDGDNQSNALIAGLGNAALCTIPLGRESDPIELASARHTNEA